MYKRLTQFNYKYNGYLIRITLMHKKYEYKILQTQIVISMLHKMETVRLHFREFFLRHKNLND